MAADTLIGYTKVLAQQVAEAESLDADINALLDPGVAEGVHLDMVGRLVGATRDGDDDDAFRVRITAIIAANRSSGTWPELLNIVNLILDQWPTYDVTLTPTYRVIESDAGSYQIHVDDINNTNPTPSLAKILGKADLAGVRGILTYNARLDDALILSDTTTVGPVTYGLGASLASGPGLAGLDEMPTE